MSTDNVIKFKQTAIDSFKKLLEEIPEDSEIMLIHYADNRSMNFALSGEWTDERIVWTARRIAKLTD